MYILIVIISVVFNALAQIFLKKSVQQLSAEPLSVENFFHFILSGVANFPLMCGLACYVISIILWLLALSRMEVSIAYPFQALGYILVTMIAYFYFHEHVTLVRILGISLISVGVFLVARS